MSTTAVAMRFSKGSMPGFEVREINRAESTNCHLNIEAAQEDREIRRESSVPSVFGIFRTLVDVFLVC